MRGRRFARILAGPLGLLALVAGWVLLGPRQLGGSVTLVSTHGDSMSPGISPQDLVIVRDAASYRVGDVVAYRDPDLDVTVLHRVVDTDGDRLVLRGDNNDWLDPTRPTQDAVLGRAWFEVPWAGRLVELPVAARIAVTTGLLGLVGAAAGASWSRRRASTARRRRRDPSAPIQAARRRTNEHVARPRAPRWLSSGTATAATLLVASGGLAGLAYSRPATEPGPLGYESHAHLEYAADVPPGPVYPSGRVATGDPVFLNQVDRLTLRLGTRLHSDHDLRATARTQLRVRVTNGHGWSQVVATGPTGTDLQDAAVVVDIDRVRALVGEVHEAIGLPVGPQTITVEGDVRLSGMLDGTPFEHDVAPEFVFTMDGSVLRPRIDDADPDPFGVTASDTVEVPGVAEAQLQLLDRDVPVVTARVAAAAVAGAALLALVVLGAGWLRLRRLDLPDRIVARHRRRVVRAQAVSLPANRTLVDVTDVEALAELAIETGRPLVFVRDAELATFVVEGDAATYRYRLRCPQRPSPLSVPPDGPSVTIVPPPRARRSVVGSS